jgi:hypothetical protein
MFWMSSAINVVFLHFYTFIGSVYLHCSDIINWDDQLPMPAGTSISFSLNIDDGNNYKAFNAKLFL